MDGEADRVRRLFLSDLAQVKLKFHNQKITTIKIETEEELIVLRKLFGASFCAGARCAPRLKDSVLPVKLHSAINAVVPPSQDSLLKIKRYKKRKVNKDNCCCLLT